MMRTETQALHKGIDYLLAGGNVEEYMEQADVRRLSSSSREELLALLGLVTVLLQLRQMPIPAPQAKAANRARFLGEAVRLKEEHRIQPTWLRLPLPERIGRGILGALLALLLVLTIGLGVTNVAASSLPDSSLYPLKLAIEDTRLAFAFSQPTRAQLYLHFANERTKEIVSLAVAGRPVHESVVTRMAEEWQGAVRAASASGAPQAPELLQRVIETSAEQKELLRQASAQAAPEEQALFAQAMAVTEEASRQAQEALRSLVTPEVAPTPTAMKMTGGFTPAVTATARATEEGVSARFTSTPAATARATEEGVSARFTSTPAATARATEEGVSARFTPTPTATARATEGGVSTRFTPMPTSTATPSPTPSMTHSPTTTPHMIVRLVVNDVPDPVPASYRIHYDIYLVNDSDVALTNVVIVASWSPRDCIYLPPDNEAQETWTVGTVDAHATHHIYFSVNTFSICAGSTVAIEVVMTCDQGTVQATQTTTIGSPPTSTPTRTPTPQFIFHVTNTDWPDPVAAGYNINYDICVMNDGNAPLTHVVLVDRWSPRDCVYLVPDNPEQMTWNIGSIAAHSSYCVHFVLSTFSICAGNSVTNEAIVSCDQGTARAEQTTTIGSPPASMSRPTLSPSPTLPPTSVSTPTATSLPVETSAPTPTFILRHP
ncbi:MAG: DUF5667 domain-containing protein [Anaerolineae bacterium]